MNAVGLELLGDLDVLRNVDEALARGVVELRRVLVLQVELVLLVLDEVRGDVQGLRIDLRRDVVVLHVHRFELPVLVPVDHVEVVEDGDLDLARGLPEVRREEGPELEDVAAVHPVAPVGDVAALEEPDVEGAVVGDGSVEGDAAVLDEEEGHAGELILPEVRPPAGLDRLRGLHVGDHLLRLVEGTLHGRGDGIDEGEVAHVAGPARVGGEVRSELLGEEPARVRDGEELGELLVVVDDELGGLPGLEEEAEVGLGDGLLVAVPFLVTGEVLRVPLLRVDREARGREDVLRVLVRDLRPGLHGVGLPLGELREGDQGVQRDRRVIKGVVEVLPAQVEVGGVGVDPPLGHVGRDPRGEGHLRDGELEVLAVELRHVSEVDVAPGGRVLELRRVRPLVRERSDRLFRQYTNGRGKSNEGKHKFHGRLSF